MISGNMVGSYSQLGKTFILTDDSGNEITGVVVDQETIFDATDNDVRQGSVYAGDSGISVGTKVIPRYYTSEGAEAILAGGEIKIMGVTNYEYTKLQVLICAFNSSLSNSVATEKVSINGKVYAVGTTDVLADVTIDSENKAINLGIVNDNDTPCIVRYFTYKEIL